jgi:hypothetical protein
MNERERQAYDTAATIASDGKHQTTKQEQRPQRFDPIREADNRLDQARQEVKRPDPPNYKGEPVREYQKQLVARSEAVGSQKAFGSAQKMRDTDREIAGRMALCGYSQTEIGSAVQKASPAAATLQNEGRQQSYARDISRQGIADAYKAQIDKGGGTIIAQNKIDKGMTPDDRRTEQLNMTQKPENGKKHEIESIRSAQSRERTTQAVMQSSPSQQQTQSPQPRR